MNMDARISPAGAVAVVKEPKHWHYIDALRGIAALAVIFVHASTLFKALPWRATQLAGVGAHGVQLFFMVSAVTLVSSWRSRSQREFHPVRGFFIRRLFRIAPMFWLAAAIYSTVDVIFVHPWATGTAINPLSLLLTVTFCHGWLPSTINLIVPGGWSIAAEMVFYLMFPALMLVVTSFRRAATLFCGAVVLALIANHVASMVYDSGAPNFSQFHYYWFPNQLPIFALGLMTYYLLPWARGAGTTVSATLLGYGVALLLVVAFGGLPWSASAAHPGVWRDLVAGLAFMAIILSLAARPWGILVNRLTRHIGKVSFGAYLWQFAALAAVKPAIVGLNLSGWAAVISVPLVFVLITAATVCAATVTYRWIEEPGIKLGHLLAGR